MACYSLALRSICERESLHPAEPAATKRTLWLLGWLSDERCEQVQMSLILGLMWTNFTDAEHHITTPRYGVKIFSLFRRLGGFGRGGSSLAVALAIHEEESFSPCISFLGFFLLFKHLGTHHVQSGFPYCILDHNT